MHTLDWAPADWPIVKKLEEHYRKQEYVIVNSSELALYLEAGLIDLNIETDERFLPKILTNNQ